MSRVRWKALIRCTFPLLRDHSSRLLKNAHLRCYPHPSSLRRTSKYASLLRISGALHLGIFEQSEKNDFFSKLLGRQVWLDSDLSIC